MVKISDRMAGLMQTAARWATLFLATVLGATAAPAYAAGNEAIAATLQKAEEFSNQGGDPNNRFGRALWLESKSADGAATGTIEAVLDFPFESASEQLSEPANWCDILILHFNVKSCAVARQPDGETVLDVGIGRKYEQPVGKVYRVSFVFSVVQRSNDLLHVQLVSEDGPLSTRNYRIVVLASPVDADKFVVQLSYAYDYGMVAKLAMEAYLGTLGRNKVGFTIEGEDSDGQPRYIRGMRGAVERNAMRYCLAVESYLRSLSRPRQEQIEARLQDWFTSSQRFSRQLYEMDRDAYLAMKRNEIARQQAATTAGGG
ncbi:MAG: hypothetical protein JSU95_16785 [Betaproteobacteria bacterium]|nr:MAG: hypothetical protein JSU95_16785 [Betaproteobacteria bacterium]